MYMYIFILCHEMLARFLESRDDISQLFSHTLALSHSHSCDDYYMYAHTRVYLGKFVWEGSSGAADFRLSVTQKYINILGSVS